MQLDMLLYHLNTLGIRETDGPFDPINGYERLRVIRESRIQSLSQNSALSKSVKKKTIQEINTAFAYLSNHLPILQAHWQDIFAQQSNTNFWEELYRDATNYIHRIQKRFIDSVQSFFINCWEQIGAASNKKLNTPKARYGIKVFFAFWLILVIILSTVSIFVSTNQLSRPKPNHRSRISEHQPTAIPTIANKSKYADEISSKTPVPLPYIDKTPTSNSSPAVKMASVQIHSEPYAQYIIVGFDREIVKIVEAPGEKFQLPYGTYRIQIVTEGYEPVDPKLIISEEDVFLRYFPIPKERN